MDYLITTKHLAPPILATTVRIKVIKLNKRKKRKGNWGGKL